MSERGTQNAPSHIKELKASAHTMALEPGLYCVFNAPGGVGAASDSGLPGVRITAAPGRSAGVVSVVGFKGDGWIGSDSAALVRVAEQAAEVLVTVYQAIDSKAEAPQLQVVRLSGDMPAESAPASAAAQPATASASGKRPTAPENVEVVAHVYGRGDVASQLGEWIGEPGSNRWIEGFGIAPLEGGIPLSELEYQAVLGRGWLSPWSEGGQFCGSRGMSLPILGLRVRLRGQSAGTHRAVLSASFVDGTRLGPIYDGDPCEAASLAALEAFQVSIEPLSAKGAVAAPASSSKPAKTSGMPALKAGPKARQPKAQPAAKPETVIPERARPARKAPAAAVPAASKGKPLAKAAAAKPPVAAPPRTPARRAPPAARRR